MPNNLERDMPAFASKQFPAGDASPWDIEKARDIFSQLTEGDPEQQIHRLQTMRSSQIRSWLNQPGHQQLRIGLKGLGEAWGNTLAHPEAGAAYATIGTYSTLAFVDISHLFPTSFMDFSEELNTMSTYNSTAIHSFANEAWAGMKRTHPDVFSMLAPFGDHLLRLNDVSPHHEQEVDLIKASAALPYVMAAATRSHNYLKDQLDREGKWLQVINAVDEIQNP